jgi:outer membrane protein OmpA-like peptidoglycan-associated protein
VLRGDRCYANIDSEYEYTDSNGAIDTESDSLVSTWGETDNNGVTRVLLQNDYGNFLAFRDTSVKADIVISNTCYSIADGVTGQWAQQRQYSLMPKAITFYNPSVTKVSIPDTVSQFTNFKVFGPGMNADAYIDAYIENPKTGARLGVNTRWINSDSYKGHFYGYTSPEWLVAQDVKFVIEQYNYDDDNEVVVLFTKNLKFVPRVATRVTLTPSKGSVLGGNTVKISGHFLCNYYTEGAPEITIGGKPVTDLSFSSCDSMTSSNGEQYDGLDRLTFKAPANSKPGAEDVVVNNGYGPVTLSQKYVYGAKPTITSFAPSSVANTGGSLVTINGSNFGTSGTPVVTIDGIKSPLVVRVSDSKLLAMVPASATVGSVEVNVISSSGGGALDLPATLNLVAASQNPTITSVTPGSASVGGGDEVTVTGTGFAAGATGVTFNGVPAKVMASTATSLTVEVPESEAAGAVSVAVGTPTGLTSKSAAFTYKVNPGVTNVAPSVIKSYDTGNAAKVTITGVGFGSKGTITVGSAKAIAYTSTGNGTTISGIAIPTSKAGTVAISILPSGAKVAFTTSVTVKAPNITYVGPNPYDDRYGDNDPFDSQSYLSTATPLAGVAGGEVFLIKGSGFGPAGKVNFGNISVTPTSYSDTEVIFVAPAAAAGKYDVTVVPSAGTLNAKVTSAIAVGGGSVGPDIQKLVSVEPNERGERANTFAPATDSSDLFEITGTGFAGSDNGAKTVVKIAERYTTRWVTVDPISVTNTKVTFRAPRNLDVLKWYQVKVETNQNYAMQQLGIWYIGDAPVPTDMVPNSGLCTKEGISPYTPAVITATGDAVFGASGTVKLGGTTLAAAAVTWTTNSVTVDLSKQTASLANPWGVKEISFIPADGSLTTRNWNFKCAVATTVTTKLNNSTADLTIAAGTAYTASASLNNALPGTTYVQPAGTYSYQTATDYAAEPGLRNVRSGLPVAAGTYYVWANPGLATYDATKYSQLTAANYVKLTLTGQAITFTPKLNDGGSTITYRGQLGDGTDGSTNDIGYTVTATADAVTKVYWQYRNHACAAQDPNWGWTSGLPNEASIHFVWCGGDDSSATSWDIRVAGFEMVSGGVDKSIYYLPTYNTFELTVNKRPITVSAIKAEKIYDGSTSISLGELTLTGGLESEKPTLEWNFANNSSFADATVGTSKPITTSGPISLDWNWRNKYVITNPDLAITGTIKKADAILKLTSNPGSVVLANNTPIALNLSTVDSRYGQPIDDIAGLAAAVVVSKTPSICTVNGLAVTALKVGDCVIEATQAASTNYNASISFKDDSTTVEQLVIKIYGSPKVLSVVADDVVVSVGADINPSYSMAGLIEGDSYENVDYLFYQGATLLNAPPTAVGTYKIVPKDGSLNAVDGSAYSDTVKYVAGKLTITPVPPTISAISPAHGPEAGGNTLVITGTGLGSVTTVKVGELVIRKPNFVVNGDGTTISFKMPKGKGGVVITLVAGASEVTTDYTYDPPAPITAPLSLKLTLKLEIGAKFAGQKVTIKGGGLKANSDYTLVMNSKPVTLFKAKTDANGNFLETIKIPAKACVAPGKHSVTLSGISPAGKKVSDTAHFVINEKCEVLAQAVKTTTKSWTLSGFLFGYCQPTLNAGGVASLKALAPLLKGAKTITVYGYTETDTKSAAIKRSNIILAQGRTDNVVAYLKKLGVKAVYKTVAKGGVDPVSITQQFKNRRVVIEATF